VHLLGEGLHLGGLFFGAGLQRFLAFEEGLELSLGFFQLPLRAAQLLHRLIAVPACTIV
jgi:hypothetical protein